MEAEEIIQQKEWHQLNTGELSIVKDLAETEQEYNLLKKMLQVSADEQHEVPAISADVKKKVTQQFAAAKVVSFKRYWYAAASVLLLVCSTWFILNRKDTINTFRGNAIVKNMQVPIPVKQYPVVTRDTSRTIEKESPLLAHKKVNIKQPFIRATAPDKNNASLQDQSLAFNTKVSDQKELLNLVTEIY